MAFDMGFNFRASAGYVTDPAYGVPVLVEQYPNTYTASNGNSINAGFDDTAWVGQFVNRSNSNDPRIAGINYQGNAGTGRGFQVDLSSGSAPGAGTYTVDIAAGDHGGAQLQDFKLFDTSTVLIDGTNGGAGFATLSGHYRDATLADVTASTTWTGATVSKTFATTTAKLDCAMDNIGGSTTLAHFRLTLATSQSVVPVVMAQYRHRRT